MSISSDRTAGTNRAASSTSRAVTAGSTLVSKPLRSRLDPTSTRPSSVVSITVEICRSASAADTAAR